jgi:polar amino acid transport system substrate-binding protein
MKIGLWLAAVMLLANTGTASPQPTSDPRVADLVKAGQVRIGTFPPQYTKDAKTGTLKGPYVEVFRAVAARIGVEPVLIELATPAKLVECLASGACDIGSLGFDPARADQVGGFTPAFMRFGYGYLVPGGSPIRSHVDADRPGNRIAVVRGHASTLALSRMARQAELISVETPDIAFDMLRAGRVEAWASARTALFDYAAELPGSRVLDDSFGTNRPALVVPKGQDARLAFISEFIEQAKASGLAKQAIERGGQPGYTVADPGER